MAYAWVLNLDAEDELALGGRAHTPSAAMETRIRALLPRLSALIAADDHLLFPAPGAEERTRAREHALQPRAWCPTRWALTRFEKAGLSPPRAPSMAVLARVNHRRFCADLGQTLPGAFWCDTALSLPPGAWLLKRPFGFAGRGRRKVTAGALSSADEAFIAASPELQVEPWVDRVLDCALHGEIAEDGTWSLGAPTIQVVDEHGAWLESRVAREAELTTAELAALHTEARRAADALAHAGYFGPFGVDAFRWCDQTGALHFQPRSEINARYSMGWAVGVQRPR